MKRPLETAWPNHSEKLRGPLCEGEAATPQAQTEICKTRSQVTPNVQTRAVRSAGERFVQAVRLVSYDFYTKTGDGKRRLFTGVETRWRRVDWNFCVGDEELLKFPKQT
jgi:hypothetical protein